MFILQLLQELLGGLVLLLRRFGICFCLLGVLDHVISIQQSLLTLSPQIFTLLGALLQLGFRLLHFITTKVHDLIVQISDFLFHRLVLLHDVLQLI
eukprot:Skav205148  [mRNA]  locus=scaffold593:172123:180557:+ [translate_table: standard]